MEQSEVATTDQSTSDPFVVTALGLRLVFEPTFDQWLKFGRKLWAMRTSLQWCVGDWLVYGEGKGEWGETYAQAVDVTHYAPQTLANFAWVSSRIDISRRREDLSWSHHEAVAPLPPVQQQAVLTQAKREGWDREITRDEVRKVQGKPPPPKPMHETFEATLLHSRESDVTLRMVEANRFVEVLAMHPGATIRVVVYEYQATEDES